MRRVVGGAHQDTIGARDDARKHEARVQTEQRSPHTIGHGVHVVRQHERLAGMKPLAKEDRLRATEEWIVQVDHIEPTQPRDERRDERGITHAQRGAQAMHEVAVARGVSVSGREDCNVVPTRAKPGRVLRGKLAHAAAVRRIGGHDMGNAHQVFGAARTSCPAERTCIAAPRHSTVALWRGRMAVHGAHARVRSPLDLHPHGFQESLPRHDRWLPLGAPEAIAMFVVLLTVFSFIFSADEQYNANLLIGLFLFDFFGESTKTGVISLYAKGYLLTKARFPSWIVVVASRRTRSSRSEFSS